MVTDEKKIKTTKAHLEKFKREFIKYQKLFGLTGWDVKFEIRALNGSLAELCYRSNECVATASLNKFFAVGEDIKKTARHEAIHLLLARYDFIASARYISPDELIQANEEIVVKLTELI